MKTGRPATDGQVVNLTRKICTYLRKIDHLPTTAYPRARRLDQEAQFRKRVYDLAIDVENSGHPSAKEIAASIRACIAAGAIDRIHSNIRPHLQFPLNWLLVEKELRYDDLGAGSQGSAPAAAATQLPARPKNVINLRRYFEGTPRRVTVTIYQRSLGARRAATCMSGLACNACNNELGKKYGPLARGAGIVHHLTPLSTQRMRHEVNPAKDLKFLCGDCHLVAHLVDPPLSVEQLKALIDAQEKSVQQND